MTADPAQGSGPDSVDHGERREDQPIDESGKEPGAQSSETGTAAEQRQGHPIEKPRNEIYSERLRLIWSAAHSQVDLEDREWAAFKRAMLDVSDVVALVGDEDEGSLGMDAGGPLDGDLDTVELLVIDKVSRQPDAQVLTSYMRNTLAPTITRFEQARVGTPERRVDVVQRVLTVLRGAPAAGHLACELFRYLQSQRPEDRQAGFYATVANLAIVVSAVGGDFRRVEGALMCHAVLDGIRSLDLPDLDGGSESSVSNMAFNLAVDVSTLLRRQGSDASGNGIEVLRDLKRISASTARRIDLEEAQAAAVTQALGFTTSQPGDFLTVLLNMGSGAEAWQDTPIGLARLEASSGIVDAATARPAQPTQFAARLFNAGISLIRAQADDRVPVIRSRLLLNTLGLRLALELSDDLIGALVGLDSLDCAVNLVGAFVEAQRIPDPDVADGVGPLVRQLVDLPRWPPLRMVHPGAAVALARLTTAGQRLGMAPQERASFPGLLPTLDDALDTLRTTRAPLAPKDVFLDAAQLVGHIFTTILRPLTDTSGLQEIIDGVAASRNQPAEILKERYARYASSPDDPVGDGPLVAAGLVERAEWDRVAEQLLVLLPSIAAALRDFPLS